MHHSKMIWVRGLVAAAALPAITAGGVAHAEEGLEDVGPPADWQFAAGGSLRVRQETFDDIPIVADPPGVTRGGKNDSLRVRTTLWTRLQSGHAVLYGRLNNEHRHWFTPSGSTSYEWPDEVIVDNLYLRLDRIFGDDTVLTVGRQDILLGSRRMVLEGTAKDGSRTIYFDGATFSAKLDELTRIDLFGVYTTAENHLAIESEHRDVTGYKAGFNDMDEAGGGVFLTSRCTEALPFELFYIYKHDTRYFWQTPEGEQRVPSSDFHTVGTRLLPRFSESVTGELEVAGQFGKKGDQDVEAYMAAGGIRWAPEHALKPFVSANAVYLSGDKQGTDKAEGWNPLWGRYPWISELYIYAWDAEAAGAWTNLVYPHLQVGCVPARGMNLVASVGPLMAERKNGPGDGDLRGWLGIARWDFPLGSDLLAKGDALRGHLLAEVLDPGDYYNVSSTSYFLRWELLYSF